MSYLPLSHVAAQFSDIVSSMMEGIQVYFADPSALQGTLIQTLQEVRPKIFFSVPRVWEKIYDKMMEIAKENGYVKSKIGMYIFIQQPGPNLSEPRARSSRVANSQQVGNSNWQKCSSITTSKKHLDWINANTSSSEQLRLIPQSAPISFR